MTPAEEQRLRLPTRVGELSVRLAGPPAGPAILLWPSIFTTARLCFDPLLPALTSAGYRALLVDPPGQGSSGPAPGTFTMESCADAAFEVADRCGVDRLTCVVGVSWGGFVALRMALSRPDRVGSLALLNTAADALSVAEQTGHRRSLEAVEAHGLGEQMAARVEAALISDASSAALPALGAALRAEVAGLDRDATTVNMRSVLLERSDVLDLVERIAAPCLIVAGAEDRQLPAVHSERMMDRLADARLAVLPRVGHLASAEAPEAVGRLILSLLADASSSRETNA